MDKSLKYALRKVKKRWLAFGLFLVSSPAFAQMPIFPGVFSPFSSSCTGPANYWTVVDYSGGTNGAYPTTTTMGTSTFDLPSGGSYTVSDTNDSLAFSTSAHTALTPTPCLNNTTFPNTSTLGLSLTTGITASDTIQLVYPLSGVPNTQSDCIDVYTTIPQTVTAFGRMDLHFLSATGTSGDFVEFQLQNESGTELLMNTEFGGGEGAGGYNFPTDTWVTVCSMMNIGGQNYQAAWNYSTGAFIAAAYSTEPANSGATTPNYVQWGSGTAGSQIGPTGYNVYFSNEFICGLVSAATNCPFPLKYGMQIMTPNDIPGPGSYSSTQTVTIEDAPVSGGSFLSKWASPTFCYTTDGTTPTGSSGTCSHGTTYSGTFNISSFPTTLQYIATSANYQNSALQTSVYSAPAVPGTVVQACDATYSMNGSPTGSVSCSTASNTTAGNTLYVAIVLNNTSATIATPTGCGVTWSTVSGSYSPQSGSQIVWFSAPIVSGAACTPSVSVSGSSGYPYLYEAVWEVNGTGGVDTGTNSNPVANQNSSYCSSCSTITFSPNGSGDLTLYLYTSQLTSQNISSMTTFTAETGPGAPIANPGLWMGHYGQSGSGNVSGTFTQASANPYIQTVIGLKP